MSLKMLARTQRAQANAGKYLGYESKQLRVCKRFFGVNAFHTALLVIHRPGRPDSVVQAPPAPPLVLDSAAWLRECDKLFMAKLMMNS